MARRDGNRERASEGHSDQVLRGTGQTPWGPADELCAEAYTAYLASFPAMDLAGHQDFAAAFYAGFPDLEHRIEDLIAEDDRAAVRFQITGTNTETFMGNPPSGKRVEVDCLALLTVASGKVTELRGQFDQMGLLQQVGAVPT